MQCDKERRAAGGEETKQNQSTQMIGIKVEDQKIRHFPLEHVLRNLS